MCICEIRKSSVKFSLLVFCAYLQLGSCGLKLLRQLSNRQFFNAQNTNLVSNTNQSPCPNVFEYRYDEVGRLFGFLEIGVPNGDTIDLEVEFCVGNRVNKGSEGSISLPYLNNQQIIDNILQGRPLNYKIHFPTWRGPQPKITKIVVNGITICTGPSYPPNSLAILTTINLRHKLHVNVTPLVSSVPSQNNNLNNFYPIDNDNLGEDTNQVFNVRNDRTRGTFVNNPYNFNPNIPKTVPEIIFKPDVNGNNENPYSRNPFLNSLSSTRSPNTDLGGNIFNGPFDSATTESTFVDITPPNRPTQAPVRRSSPNPEPVIRDGTSQYQNDVCGRPVVTNSLILKGHSVPRGAFPWLVAMFVKTNIGLEYQCTGTLVSKRHVVTAAHCVKPDSYAIQPDKIVLVMGRMNIQGWGASDGEKIIGAEQVFIHEDYKLSTADADISVITLKAEVTFTKFIRPICLWTGDADLRFVVGLTGIVVGWGRDETGQKVSPEPKQIELPIVSQEQCLRSNYSFVEITSERTFCAGDRSGSGPCNGDSGSGFVMLKNRRWHLKGIVSMSLSDAHTRTCDLSNYVVFTDASKYNDWLLSVIQ